MQGGPFQSVTAGWDALGSALLLQIKDEAGSVQFLAPPALVPVGIQQDPLRNGRWPQHLPPPHCPACWVVRSLCSHKISLFLLPGSPHQKFFFSFSFFCGPAGLMARACIWRSWEVEKREVLSLGWWWDRAGVSQGGLGLGQISGSLLLLSACISNPHGEMRSAFPQPEVCTGSCLGSPNYFFPRRKKCVYAFFSTSWRLDAARKSIPNKKSGINVNYTSVRFTFILIRHISSKCDFLLGLVIKVFCTAKETSPVLFSGSMNSRICLWVFQLLRHQWGSVRSGTRRWQAAFLSLLIYCLSENQILNTWSINIISALK